MDIVEDHNDGPYLVFVTRENNSGTRDFYFLTEDNKLVGDASKAKRYNEYADVFKPIWDGILWQQNDKIKSLGFRRASYIPLSELDAIRPEWRGKEEICLDSNPNGEVGLPK